MLQEKITARTVQNRLMEQGYYGSVVKTKPYLRAINKQKRLLFAQNHKDWTIDQWNSVLWSDPSSGIDLNTKNNSIKFSNQKK